MLGIFLGFVAALGFGTAPVLARIGLLNMRSSSGTVISLVIGFMVVLLLAIAFNLSDIRSLSALAFLWFAVIGVLNFVIGRLLNFTGVSLAGATRTASVLAISPLFAAIFAITLGGEPLTLPIVLGTLSISAGVILIVGKQ